MCWSSHRELHGYWEASRRARQQERETTRRARELRVSDADRDEVIAQLSRHTGDGRLTLEEFEERVEAVYNAKTEPELRHTLRDLPADEPRRRRERHRATADLGYALRPIVAVIVVGAVIALSVPWMLWFIVPMAWCRFGAWGHAQHSDDEGAPEEHDELTLV